MQYTYTSPGQYFNRRPSLEERREKTAEAEHEYYRLKADIEARHKRESEHHSDQSEHTPHSSKTPDHPTLNHQTSLSEQIKQLSEYQPSSDMRHLHGSTMDMSSHESKAHSGGIMQTHFRPPAGPDQSSSDTFFLSFHSTSV